MALSLPGKVHLHPTRVTSIRTQSGIKPARSEMMLLWLYFRTVLSCIPREAGDRRHPQPRVVPRVVPAANLSAQSLREPRDFQLQGGARASQGIPGHPRAGTHGG